MKNLYYFNLSNNKNMIPDGMHVYPNLHVLLLDNN